MSKTIVRNITCALSVLLINIFLFNASTISHSAAQNSSDRIIVSMGDSYSSGEGIDDFYDYDLPLENKVESQDWLSHRSKNAWGGQLSLSSVGKMSESRNENWYFTAMSGAVTGNFLDTEPITNDNADDNKHRLKEYFKFPKSIMSFYRGEPIQGTREILPQIFVFDELKEKNKKADYVTLTLGGNDAEFENVIISVALTGTFLNRNMLWDKLHDVENNLPTIIDNLQKTYKLISEKAGEDTYIIVAGYPPLLDVRGTNILRSKEKAWMVNNDILYFNEQIKNRINSLEKGGMKIRYVSVFDEFDGHEAYSGGENNSNLDEGEFLNRIIIGAKEQDIDDRSPFSAYSMHPNKKGAEVYRKCVQTEIDRIEKEKGTYDNSKENHYESKEEVVTNTSPNTNHNSEISSDNFQNTSPQQITAFDLIDKSSSEIIEMMGGDFECKLDDDSVGFVYSGFGSSGVLWIFNENTLPGFAFHPDEESYSYELLRSTEKDYNSVKSKIKSGNYNFIGIAIRGDKKLNDQISADMTYSEIASVVGDFEIHCAAQGAFSSHTSINGKDVAFFFEPSDELYAAARNNKLTVSADTMRQLNPKLEDIVVRKQ